MPRSESAPGRPCSRISMTHAVWRPTPRPTAGPAGRRRARGPHRTRLSRVTGRGVDPSTQAGGGSVYGLQLQVQLRVVVI